MLMKGTAVRSVVDLYPSTSRVVPADFTSYCLGTRSKVKKYTLKVYLMPGNRPLANF